MKNSVLNYSTEELDEFIVSDYFSKDVGVYSIFTTLEPYLEVYKMSNSDKLERIAYELYGNTDYWDILLMINDRNPLFEMAYDYDILYTDATTTINQYANFIYSHAPLTSERSDVLLADLMQTKEDENEAYRFIYIIKPTLLNDAISILKQQGYV